MGIGVPGTVLVAEAVAVAGAVLVAVAVVELVGLHAAKSPTKIKINEPQGSLQIIVCFHKLYLPFTQNKGSARALLFSCATLVLKGGEEEM